MFLKKYILLFLVFTTILLSGCFQSKIIVTTNKKLTLKMSVAEVRIQNNQLIIEGNGLSSITTIKLVDAGVIQNFNIESATQNQLVAKGLSTVGIGVGKVFDLILSNANGASTFPVVFTLNNGSITGAQLNNMGATTGQVLRFNGSIWAPGDLSSSQFYFGVWNANTDTPNLAATSPSAGDYYIVSVAGTHNSVSYNVGDWIIYNGSTWDQIHNSSTITNVFGRTGVVIGVKGDYSLTKMADVDLVTTPPTTNQVLKYNGTNWVPGTVSAGGSGTVTSVTASAPLSVTNTTTTPAISIAQATTATDGYLSATHWNTFNNKEPAITSAATTKYFRGDKTFVTLDSSVVPENTNLYFTNARVLGVPLTGFNNSLTGVVTATDSVLQAFGRIQNQITTLSGDGGNYLIKNAPDTLSGAITLTNVITASGAGDIIVNSVPLGMTSAVNKTYADTKQSAITIASTLNTGSITSNLQGGVVVNPYGGAAGNTGEVHFNELAANGANYIALKAPDSLAANIAFTLPAADGSAGQILKTNGAGILSWVNDNAGAGAFSGTINKAVATDGAGALTTSATSATELGYVAGVTSAIQTQLNAKQTTTLASANFLVGNGSNIATGVAMSGDATLANTGAITLNTVPITKGGTGANITPVNGGIIYSNASALAVSAAGTTGQILRSAGVAAPVWSTATYPTTVGVNNILFGSSSNVVGEITTANSNILATNSSGVPSWNSPASIKTLLSYGTAANQNTGSLINTIPMFGANATVGSMCTYDLTLGFICNTPIPSGGSLSGLTAATATNTIDNLTFAQIWNWTTATTQSLMTMAANALTTGSVLSLTTSNAMLNSTNGLLNVANTGSSTSGLLAKFQSNSTAGSGMTVLANGNVGVGSSAPNSNLQVAGSIAIGFASKTSNYTLTSSDSIVAGDATSGAITLTLPTAVGAAGRLYTIKKIDNSTNAVNLATTSSQTIDGSTTRVLSTQYGYMALVSDGANWLVTATSNACAVSGSTTFNYTGGTQSFVVPCANFTVKMWGAGGGGGPTLYGHSPTGGAGGFTSASMFATVGDTLTIYVGGGGAGASGTSGSKIAPFGGGYGGGGGSTATTDGAGGGRSAIRNAGNVELVTAGGGGGGGTLFSASTSANGGAGGGLTGSAGGQAGTMIPGGGGTPSAGGAGGSNSTLGDNGVAGTQYTGGQNTAGTYGSCGGGAGYYGGGTAAMSYGSSGDGSGCGGGSSYYGGGGVTNGITTAGSGATAPNTGDASYSAGIAVGGSSGSAGGNGKVVISW